MNKATSHEPQRRLDLLDRSGRSVLHRCRFSSTHLLAALIVLQPILAEELDNEPLPHGSGFGVSVAVNSDVAAVGAYKDRTASAGAGSVLVYSRAETNWPLATVIYPDPPQMHGMFGFSLALADNLLVVGAPGDSVDGSAAGAVHLYRQEGTTNWTRESVAPVPLEPWGRFGHSVSADDWLAVGAPLAAEGSNHCGCVHLFSDAPAGWTNREVLWPTDRQAWQQFGYSVATVSNLVAVGAPHSDRAGVNSGAVYVFAKTETGWILESTLTMAPADAGDLFGSAVSLTTNRLAVGCVGDDWQGANSGSVQIYRRQGSNWVHEAQVAGASTSAGDAFGWSVSMSGNLLAVGARRHGRLGMQPGAAYLFRADGGGWVQVQEFAASDSEPWDIFGCAVSVTPANTLVGAERHRHKGTLAGGAYLFENP